MPADVMLFLPEAVVLLGALTVFILPLLGVASRACWVTASLASLVAVAASAWGLGLEGEPFAPGVYRVDVFSQLLKLGLTSGLALVALLGIERDGPSSVRADARPEVPIFLFLSTAGMMMLVSATELLTFYVSLELSAYTLFVMVALRRAAREGSEAAAKYVLFGIATSALSLYGISILFGVARSTYFDRLAALPAETLGSPAFLLGLFLLLAGLLFKLAIFPFHAWAPDAYEAAPHQVATFLGTASKVAAVGVLARVCALGWEEPERLATVLWVLCVLSMCLGNLAALVQKDFKRLLGWSAVAQGGYVLIGLLCFDQAGTAAAIFYAIAYLFMAAGPFVVATIVGRDDEQPDLDSLSGLWFRSPFLAVVLIAGMFGLAGIPPTAGFIGKWTLFSAAADQGRTWLVLIAALNATVSLYYYLQVVRRAWVHAPEGRPAIRTSPAQAVAATAALVLTVLLGVWPEWVYDLAREAAATLAP
jgi:NADH-quinone oxidoreductase subunit N